MWLNPKNTPYPVLYLGGTVKDMTHQKTVWALIAVAHLKAVVTAGNVGFFFWF